MLFLTIRSETQPCKRIGCAAAAAAALCRLLPRVCLARQTQLADVQLQLLRHAAAAGRQPAIALLRLLRQRAKAGRQAAACAHLSWCAAGCLCPRLRGAEGRHRRLAIWPGGLLPGKLAEARLRLLPILAAGRLLHAVRRPLCADKTVVGQR